MLAGYFWVKFDFDSVIDSTAEEVMDLQIESQLELDNGFTKGNYTIEFVEIVVFCCQVSL